ncbi:MAG: phosphoglycerate mutase family protein [Proteobacteria bacterium]|nr:phosphoglycerate mutase family protein [Pseudomonadota bacterium]
MEDILRLAEENQEKARLVIAGSGVIECWEEIGAEVNLIGSLKMGLLMKHRDIDFHIYTPELKLADSFRAIARLADKPRIKRIEYANLLDEEDSCLEWHAWYEDYDGQLWQIDMMHIVKGSTYDGYFEDMAARIVAALTPELKETILRLKWQTPDDVKIPGIEYYMAVMRDNVRTYDEFIKWRQTHPQNGIVTWRP